MSKPPETAPKPSTSSGGNEQAERRRTTGIMRRQLQVLHLGLLELKLTVPINTKVDCEIACRQIKSEFIVPQLAVDIEGGTIDQWMLEDSEINQQKYRVEKDSQGNLVEHLKLGFEKARKFMLPYRHEQGNLDEWMRPLATHIQMYTSTGTTYVFDLIALDEAYGRGMPGPIRDVLRTKD